MTIKATTILAVRRGNKVAIAGDGQVTLGNEVMKHTAHKVRKIADDTVLTGFAGSAADAFALMERFEEKMGMFNNNLVRSATELAKDWRMDRALRRLESMLIVADKNNSLLLGGSGDVIESDDGILAIGSGGGYAASAARALLAHTKFPAAKIAKEALKIAGNICIYTNTNIVVEEL